MKQKKKFFLLNYQMHTKGIRLLFGANLSVLTSSLINFSRKSVQFGGKLVTFGKFQATVAHDSHHQTGEHPLPASYDVQSSQVTIHQVVTDSKLVENSQFLENTLQTGNFVEYCNYKIESAGDNEEQASIWRFIQVSTAFVSLWSDQPVEKFFF